MFTRHRSEESHARSGAFTLVEVVLAVTILALLAGVLFSLVQGTLETAAQINTRQLQTQEFNGLVEVCRNTFATLDPRAQFSVEVKSATGGGSVQELSIRGASLAFAWDGDGTEEGLTLISARPQANGLLGFCLQHQIDEQQTTTSVAGLAPVTPEASSGLNGAAKWFVLVRDLKKIEWRFWNNQTGEWQLNWEQPSVRPSMVELTINSSMSPDDTRIVFAMLPSIQGGI